MGRKSSFCCAIFSFSRKSRRYHGDDEDSDWEQPAPAGLRKVRSSDEDYGWWVGERDVDQKAADFIASFHQRSARLVV
ncbi:hypothetical protein BRADI_5g12781v3 [Brachypodium distachyon]|uniref:Uncharacterized protein n=1 Tax=Brachypodium distachyon TaxID=15368 RepID=A0A0Q3E9I5_BRADI|nr:hypothetical protein BRADI_5g12781v3 [Brachypodium distachyon]